MSDMAATMERLDEYKTHNSQFCKRMYDFLSISFVYQVRVWLALNVLVTKDISVEIIAWG